MLLYINFNALLFFQIGISFLHTCLKEDRITSCPYDVTISICSHCVCTCINITSILQLTWLFALIEKAALKCKKDFLYYRKNSVAVFYYNHMSKSHTPRVRASELLHLMCCPFSAIVIVVVRLVLRRRLLLAALAPTTTRRLAVAFSCFATMVLM